MSTLFNIEFQKKVLHLFSVDLDFYRSFSRKIQVDSFEQNSLKIIYNCVVNLINKYDKSVDLSSLLIELTNYCNFNGVDLTNVPLLEETSREVFSSDITNIEYIKDNINDFAVKQAFKAALYSGVTQLQNGGELESVIKLMNEAISLGADDDIGSTLDDVFNVPINAKRRLDPSTLTPSGFPTIDGIWGGGWAPGEVHIVAAPPKTGKSNFGCNVGVGALAKGKNVFHITMELSEFDILLKYASILTGFGYREVVNLQNFPAFKRKMEAFRGRNLFVKEYPMRTNTCNDFRAWIISVINERNVSPDLIILDYDDLIRPLTSRKNSNMFQDGGDVIKDVFNLAKYFNCPAFVLGQVKVESWGFPNQGIEIRSGMLSQSSMKVMHASSISTLNFSFGNENGYFLIDLNRRGKSDYKIHMTRDPNSPRFFERIVDQELPNNPEQTMKQLQQINE